MDMSSTCVCKERVESARGQGGSVGSKAAISLAVLALAQLGVSADNGAFSVAMSEMIRVFGCSVADVQLANTVYALMAGTFMLASGLFGLMVGWRRTFVGGMVLIVIGEIVTALAPVVELLIVLVPVELWMERAHDVAILPSSFIKSAQVRSGVVAIALPFFYMGAQGLVATSFYQLVVGLGGTSTALLGIVSGVPMLVLAMGIPRKFPQANSWLVVRCGYIAIALGAMMAAFGVRSSELTSIMVLGTLLGGIGVGMVNSQSNNLVASAVPAHDAQQSGGIQGAARNLGLALGSAAMGSVMLIAVNMGLDARVESMAVLDEPVRTALEQTVYTYEGDAAFSARMDGMGVSDPVAGELIAANREVRANAGAIAMSTVAALAGLSLFTTFPKKSKDAARG